MARGYIFLEGCVTHKILYILVHSILEPTFKNKHTNYLHNNSKSKKWYTKMYWIKKWIRSSAKITWKYALRETQIELKRIETKQTGNPKGYTIYNKISKHILYGGHTFNWIWSHQHPPLSFLVVLYSKFWFWKIICVTIFKLAQWCYGQEYFKRNKNLQTRGQQTDYKSHLSLFFQVWPRTRILIKIGSNHMNWIYDMLLPL